MAALHSRINTQSVAWVCVQMCSKNGCLQGCLLTAELLTRSGATNSWLCRGCFKTYSYQKLLVPSTTYEQIWDGICIPHIYYVFV